jgi:hypothetical protein
VIAARDKGFGVKTADIRKKRIEAIGYEVPAVPLPEGRGRNGATVDGDGRRRANAPQKIVPQRDRVLATSGWQVIHRQLFTRGQLPYAIPT